jgi:hypothetical protein
MFSGPFKLSLRVPRLACPTVFLHCWTSQPWHPTGRVELNRPLDFFPSPTDLQFLPLATRRNCRLLAIQRTGCPGGCNSPKTIEHP